jgi:stage II sporulation protein D
MVEGSLARAGSRTLRLRKGDQEIRLASPRAMALFIDLGAGPMPHPRIALYPGDRVRCSTGPDGEARYLLVLPSRKGLSDDRYSPTYGWEVSMTASDITKALGSRFELGTLRDLVPERRGVSGRVVALRVIGERGEALITGFNVRSLLGLKESLFALDRQKDPDGTLRRVIFSGKGWGHGVGLCQVGAFGMAARGAGFHEILRHYYTGIDLSKVY